MNHPLNQNADEALGTPPWWGPDLRAISPTDRAGARACWKAAVCLEATCFALMAIRLELEQQIVEAGGTLRDCEAFGVLCSLVDPVNELEADAAMEFERITGHRHPILFPYY